MTQVRDFHFSRIFCGDRPDLSLARHLHYLVACLGLKPGMSVLQVGCETGRIACELANIENVSVVGIDPDSSKVECASRMARELRLQNRVSFAQGRFDDIRATFHDRTFDAILSIEATKSSPSFESMYNQFAYILKPEGKVAVFEWCWTDTFDPYNRDHCRLAHLLEDVTRIGHRPPLQRTVESAFKALETSSFDIVRSEDLASLGKSTLPWFTHLEYALSETRAKWASDDGSHGDFGSITKEGATVLVQAGRHQLFTPMAFFVARLRRPLA